MRRMKHLLWTSFSAFICMIFRSDVYGACASFMSTSVDLGTYNEATFLATCSAARICGKDMNELCGGLWESAGVDVSRKGEETIVLCSENYYIKSCNNGQVNAPQSIDECDNPVAATVECVRCPDNSFANASSYVQDWGSVTAYNPGVYEACLCHGACKNGASFYMVNTVVQCDADGMVFPVKTDVTWTRKQDCYKPAGTVLLKDRDTTGMRKLIQKCNYKCNENDTDCTE